MTEMTEEEKDEALRREREMRSTLAQIRSFNQKRYAGWRLDVPVWKLALEGLCLFGLAFLTGFGFAVLFEIIRK